jgi:hypothetical protein
MGKALEIASRISDPWTVAVFAAALAAIVLVCGVRTKRPKLPSAVWVIASVGMIVLGVAPLIAHGILQWHGVYHVRAIVLGPDKLPVDAAKVTSSIGGEPKRIEGGLEFDIPPQARPADGRLVLFASDRSAFLTGSSTVVLGRDYYPTVIIPLAADTSAAVRGIVVDGSGRQVVGARVWVAGYGDVAVTDQTGGFVLPAHAAARQIVDVRAEKDRMSGSAYVPAGSGPVEIAIRRP